MSDNTEGVYIEHPNGRLYRVIDRDVYPLDGDGVPCRCVADDDQQTIEIVSFCRGTERAEMLAEAMGHPLATGASWRLVPVQGHARTGQTPVS